jgi:hypothetical protein
LRARIFLVLFCFVLISCSKENKTTTEKQTPSKNESEEIENPQDTNMTPEERFSSSIMTDLLDNSDDDDLASYLEDELHKYGDTYRGTTVLQLADNLWFVTLDNPAASKNFLLEKFIDFKTNDYYFKLTETNLKISDVITPASLFRNSKPEKEQQESTQQKPEQK